MSQYLKEVIGGLAQATLENKSLIKKENYSSLPFFRFVMVWNKMTFYVMVWNKMAFFRHRIKQNGIFRHLMKQNDILRHGMKQNGIFSS